MNNFALILSTIAKAINKKATGFGLYLTTIARDGGLREDSLAMLACMVHPRTSQRHDQKVLANGWNDKLSEYLRKEKEHFQKIRVAEKKLAECLNKIQDQNEIEAASKELDDLLDSSPPQFQMVWDNLNLSTKHRFERSEDRHDTTSRVDWMASMWIRDRINVNHMDNRRGVTAKDVESLSINDMIPSMKEKDYIFINLVHYFTSRLVKRHPMIFKSIANCVRPNKPHQFQTAMNQKSEEITGNLILVT